MGVSLSKGAKISLEKAGTNLTRTTMGLGWDVRKKGGIFSGLLGGGSGGSIDLDASALLFDAKGGVVDQVWFGQKKSKDGSIVHTGDNLTGAGDGDDEQIRVDLSSIPYVVNAIVFVVSSYRGDTFDRIENAFCRLLDDKDAEFARYDLSGSGDHTAQIMAKVVRVGAGWEMVAIGEKARGRTVHDLATAARAHV